MIIISLILYVSLTMMIKQAYSYRSIPTSSRVYFRSKFLSGGKKIGVPDSSKVSSSRLRAVAYDHLAIEAKWQKYWDDHNTFVAKRRPGKPKKYILDMFPYPSGAGLHVGHPEGYTATDIMSRYYRMRDYDVLHPMGWDAFGLPAEQHAINTGTHPAVTTYKNIATFKRQLKSLGFSYDWSRELSTTDEEYMKWTQWIFLQLFRANLAFQSEVSVNWCPALGTVLANEEVINGLSERGNHPVIRQPLRQWVLKITQYADKLLENLPKVEWPEGTLTAQRQWIGRSEGASIRFPIAGDGSSANSHIEVFTTRPDTLLGVTYLVLAPEHPLVSQLTIPSQQAAVKAYQQEIIGKSDLDRTATGKERGKSGVALGTYVLHPLTQEKIPLWIADYVLAGYGTGTVMAVPAHDERDYLFAQNFNLPIKQVIQPPPSAATATPATEAATVPELPYCEDEGSLINSSPLYNGLSCSQAKQAIVSALESKQLGSAQISYKLRDWVFSRQRYWGEPIPIYFPIEFLDTSESQPPSPLTGSKHRICYETPIPVPLEELPLTLPAMTDFQPGDDPQGCLARAKDWRYFQKDEKWYARETNTMPQWAGSCWYYLRFMDPTNTERLVSEQAAQDWLPVDLYIGGQEHAVLHLLYARFWHKVLYDLNILPKGQEEPFQKLVHQGMILGSDNEKMSKSRGNVINPDDIVQEFGADALRLYEMFMGPLIATKPWQTEQLIGVVRFRDRVYSLLSKVNPANKAEPTDELLSSMHKMIKKVTQDIENLDFNTAISAMMVYSNKLSSYAANSQSNNQQPIPRKAYEALLLCLAPFAPHVAEECWSQLSSSSSSAAPTSTLTYVPWPSYDEKLCEEAMITMGIQINGKVRSKMEVPKECKEEEAMETAMAIPAISKMVEGKPIKKIVYIPGRILNILV